MNEPEFNFEIEEGVVEAPERIAVIGAGGIGKTTFAACAPRPIMLDVEKGSRRFKHVGRNKEQLDSWPKLKAAVDWLRNKPHPYKTVVLDTLDRAEALCWQYLCELDGVRTIENFQKGYGKGYTAAYEEFRSLFGQLEQLLETRDMHVIILAHPKVEKVNNPISADYSRHTFKVHSSVGNLMYEACDHVLFAQWDIRVDDTLYSDDKYRAIGGEKRFITTVGSPGLIAKTRVGMPSRIPMAFHDFICFLAQAGSTRLLRETVHENARRYGDAETLRKVVELIADQSKPNYVKLLAQANRKLMDLCGGIPGMSVPVEPEPPQESAKPSTDSSGQAAQAAQPTTQGTHN